MEELKQELKKTVQDYLNEVDYTAIDNYKPSQFALEFVNFMKLVDGGENENKTPPVHFKMLDNFVQDNGLDTLNMCHRGFAKSTLKEYLILYLAVFGELPGFGKVPYALYVSDSMDNGIKKMRKALEYRYYNSTFLKKYIKDIKFTDIRWEFINIEGRSFVVSGHGAKALSLDSTLYTEYAQTTIGECKVGDQIYGADGKLATIIAKSEVFHKPMYRLHLADGRSIKVSEDHINSVLIRGKHSYKKVPKNLTTSELLELPLVHKRDRGNRTTSENLVFVQNCKPVEFPEEKLPIEPYTLGVVLGDGRIRKDYGSVELTAHVDDFPHYLKEVPYSFGKYQIDTRNSNVRTQSIRGLGKDLMMMKLNVHGDYKFIPELYKRGSIEQRLSLLQGLMDTDGTVGDQKLNPVTSFCSNSKQLAEDVMEIVYSLGGHCFLGRTSSAYRVQIHLNMPLFRLQRKLDKQKFVKKDYVAVTEIEPIPIEPSQCIAIDNEEHQFITGMFFRTHNTGVRGTRENGSRPVLALLDDLISDEDARSPTVIQSVEDTINKAIDYALHPQRRKVIWSGTPFNAKDPLYKAVESGAYNVNVYPVAETFPCEREDFKGSWEDRFDYDSVMKMYVKAVKSGKAEAFNQELMLQIMSEEDRLIQDGDIVWYNRKNVLDNIHAYNFYITTDFATSDKQSADFSVISVWAYNNNGDWLWVDGICRRQTMDRNLDDLFRLVQMYNPIKVGVEVTGQQGGFIHYIKERMGHTGIWFSLASDNNSNKEGIRPVTNKFQRFNTMVPLFKNHKIMFPKELAKKPEMVQCMDELTLLSVHGFKSKHDDFSDTISMLSVMKPFKPAAQGTLVRDDSNDVYYWDEPEDFLNDRMNSYTV